jgi:cytochrome c-type biogenesis protein CcmF
VVLGRAFRTAPAAGEHGGGLLGRLLAGHFVVVGTVLGVATIGTLAPLVTDLRGGDGIAIEGRYFASFAGPLAAAGLALVALVPLALRLSSPRPTLPGAGIARTADHPGSAGRRLLAAHVAHAGLGRGPLVPLGLRRRTGRRLIAAELAVAGGGAALGLWALYEAGGEVDWRVAVLGSAAGAALAAAVGGGIRAGRSGRRVAAHVAHAGLGLLLLGVAGTASGRTETLPVAPGERVELLGVTVEYRGVEVVEDVANAGGRVEGSSAVVADIRAAGHDLRPSLVANPANSRVIAESSLVSTPWRDVQVGLRDAADDGSAIVQIGVHPLQVLVWWGGLVLIAAGVLVAAEHRRRPDGKDRRDRPESSITSELSQLSQLSEPLAQPSML